MEAMMPSADFLSTPELNYEQWRDLLRPNWGLYTPDDPEAFAGRVRSRSICGFNASDISNSIRRCERTQRDARLDGVDHCYAVFQIAGRSTLIQNDHAVTLAVGDVALIDSARPVTYVNVATNSGYLCDAASAPDLPSDLSRRVAFVAGPERVQDACCSNSFWMPPRMRNHCPRRLATTCSWQFMISSEHYSHR
jgi:hypothetical protein